MSHKLGFLVNSHKVVCKTGFSHYIDGFVIKVLTHHARFGHGSDFSLHLQTNLMSVISLLWQPAYRIDTAHISHISIEITSQIYHNALPGLQQCTVGTARYGRVKSLSAQGKIVWTGSRSIISCQHATHEYVHAAAKDTEDAQTPLQTHQSLYFDRKLPVGHAQTVNRRNLRVCTGMGRPLSVWPDGAWLTPLGPVTVDASLAAGLCEGPTVFEADTHAHLREHALEVILPFLQVHQPEPFRIVPVCVGTRQRDVLHQAGRDLARLLAGRLLPKPSGESGGDMPQVALVVSSDMNHYEDQHRTLQKDDMALRHALAGDADGLLHVTQREGISMCGAAPLALALYALRQLTGKTPPLAEQTLHDTSGSISGDMEHVVGYAGLRFFLP